MEVHVSDAPAASAGVWLARRLRDAVRRRDSASLAVSGGSSAPPLFDALLEEDVPWAQITVWQVDERIAPDGDPGRNAGQLALIPASVKLMPVTDGDLQAAARRYGAGLPERFDVVHLGLGDDGHTASWPPGDAVVDSDRPCEVVGDFNGFARMTLTPLVVNRARSRLVLTFGRSKAPMVARWLLRDPELPVDRLRRSATVAFVDPAAVADLPPPTRVR
ncbi:MAG TPA: 6-phosphogluconolactonase [Ilumatobacteraceae bacterium]|nr:6-phosphogluconolactonase [Ilumatobacteraceae bacterium]